MSTLTVIGIALAVFMVFTAIMTWVRQYLVIHTGNRVDAVLGTQVFSHLFKLPTRYFEQRPTGVVVARMHAIEDIREFITGAAVTLISPVPPNSAQWRCICCDRVGSKPVAHTAPSYPQTLSCAAGIDYAGRCIPARCPN